MTLLDKNIYIKHGIIHAYKHENERKEHVLVRPI